MAGENHPGAPARDVGSGSGRDDAWLNQHGYPAIGLEPSPMMIAEARKAYPDIEVRLYSLPELTTIEDASFDNVLCVAVLMHLPPIDLRCAVVHLARILRPGGRLIVSYRTPPPECERAIDGRLFTTISPAAFTSLLSPNGFHYCFWKRYQTIPVR